MAEGVRVLREGRADIVVCGGSEVPFSATMVSSFHSARALATPGDDQASIEVPWTSLPELALSGGIVMVRASLWRAATHLIRFPRLRPAL